ncbi:MAG: cob(I)yrinic acid a,c-diamide adenosyltransferase [Solirubrobacterales bacterium]
MVDSENRGRVHVYTGNGKGKTTAAVGLTVRACGAGWPAALLQFLKSGHSSELAVLESLQPPVRVIRCTREHAFFKQLSEAERQEVASETRVAFETAREMAQSGTVRLLVLDEILIAQYYGLVAEDELLELIQNRHPELELVLTGRYATERIIAAADLVTEMREIKHYFHRGDPARHGIES